MSEHVDVLIVGAGLSGIGAAHHIQAAFPDKTYAILEARDAIGGTWDLFRYPGVRSDSDMYTLGYRFRPWGLRLESGAELAADIVVTATGLQLLAFGDTDLIVDDRPVRLPETMAYKGMMLSGVPSSGVRWRTIPWPGFRFRPGAR
jgi:cation diffusion facilitator CzcD-associated flavoprotein CzcO